MVKKLNVVWMEGLDLWSPVFIRAWPWLAFATGIDVLVAVIADFLKKMNEAYTPLAMAFSFVVQLAVSGIGIIIVNQMIEDVKTRQPTRTWQKLNENIKYVFVESARALMKMMLGFLLIVPGIALMVKLYFVPYIAQFDPEYKKGHVDALEHSKKLCEGYFWPIAWILILTGILSMVSGFWLDSIEMAKRPFAFTTAFFLSMALELYADIVLFCTYKKLQKFYEETTHGPALPLQRTVNPRAGTHL